jgi:hypothetical protein
VTESGPDTAKNLSFAFSGLKGEKGDQGNTGVSADYPITIANNLTTDDPTAALAASQGVVLKGEIDQLGQEVDENKVTISEHTLSIGGNPTGIKEIPNLEIEGVLSTVDEIEVSSENDVQHILITENGGTRDEEIVVSSNDGAVDYFRISKDGVYFNNKGTLVNLQDVAGGNVKYVATNGDDSNNGTAEHPLATINAALSVGAEVVILYGGVYEQMIDLSLAGLNLKIASASESDLPIIKPTVANYIIANGGESLESGTTKVYKVTLASNPFAATQKWIYQEGVNDASTIISNGERHPLHRGKEYRLENTRIVKTEASTKSEAISEIESADVYKWFFDASTSTLYFSRPVTTSTSHPICAARYGANLFSGNNRKVSLTMIGVDVWYQSINASGMVRASFIDCADKYSQNSGAFTWHGGMGVYMERCEAASNQYGELNGDGFNSGISNYTQGEPFAHKDTMLMIDCWSHDNNDDGYSGHMQSEGTIIGGLFEYNQKAGITPATGDNLTCYCVLSRKNIRGFLYAGGMQSDDQRKDGQLSLFSCLAEGNTLAGFMAVGDGLIIANDCKSINNNTGYYSATGCYLKLIDCKSLSDATNKVEQGTIEILTTNNLI